MVASSRFRILRTTALLALFPVLSCTSGGDSGGGGGGGGPTAPDPNLVATISVSIPQSTLPVGTTATAAASAVNAAGGTIAGTSFTWSSSAPDVATVASSGLVTAVAPGSATITAAAGGRSGSVAVTVIQVPVASVLVSPAVDTISIGGTRQFQASVRDAQGTALSGRTVAWSSSDPAKATVSTTGVVTGVDLGTVSITATSEGRSGAATLVIAAPPVATVALTPALDSIGIGGSTQLTATLRDAGGNALTGRTITWTSGTPAVASVSNTGLVTAASVGTTTITATSEGKSATATVVVWTPPVASVVISPAVDSLDLGGTRQLTAQPRDAKGNPLSGRTIAWATANPAVATVSESGLVTAVAIGSTFITATSEGRTGNATIVVREPGVASVEVAPGGLVIPAGDFRQYTVVLKDASGAVLSDRPVAWSSSAPGVAAIAGTGLLTGVTPGSATISANVDGKVGTAEVTVSPAASPPSAAGFTITLRYINEPQSAQQAAFEAAAQRWSQIITGDLSDVNGTLSSQQARQCAEDAPAIEETIDDLLIFVRLAPIDGRGRILGSAGPCFIRNSNQLSVVGSMTFDSDDLGALSSARLNDLILHEMGHVLGIGSLWSRFSLLQNASDSTNTLDTSFSGARAIAAFDQVGGISYSGAKVPVENTGGRGTINSHWRESVFDTELMTGFLDSGANPLSRVTVESLGDLGYEVNPTAAEGYTLPSPAPAPGLAAAPDAGKIPILELPLLTPIGVVDERGRILRWIPRDLRRQ